MHIHINIAKLFYYICIYHTYNSQYKVNIKFHTAVKLYIKIRRRFKFKIKFKIKFKRSKNKKI